ncbi:MAG TPA: 6-carboxytetrahydropterin synthase [Longimicrobiales bacterium]|nr:6-carboxytetrahydropterin synthase [Longimicrobiales bacterium]
MPEYKVSVEKDYLVFAAGHFITYGGLCEALHGHNYRARVELEGELDENHYVFDFGALKKIMRRLVDELDHRMLLPLENPHIVLAEEDGAIRVTYGKRVYVFPREDVVLLPVPNTTAEMLARHLGLRLRDELARVGATNVSVLRVEVEESFGQAAHYREELR